MFGFGLLGANWLQRHQPNDNLILPTLPDSVKTLQIEYLLDQKGKAITLTITHINSICFIREATVV